MSTYDADREADDPDEDLRERDEERLPEGETRRERDETEVDPEAGENPS